MRTTLGVLGVLSALAAVAVRATNNGLAKTPPMGWLSWERFRCNTDCTDDPQNCISENLYMAMADQMVADGWVDVGYNRVNVDDCWAAMSRAANGSLVPDPTRFPHGMDGLAQYMHDRGLLLGLYGDDGNYTCGGYPGTLGHYQQDAQTIASWGVDAWKMDGCWNPNLEQMPAQYAQFESYLVATGRPILYSCSWPAYWQGSLEINYTLAAQSCNLWRLFDDIQDEWSSVEGIIDFWGDHYEELRAAQSPGAFNDPDMLIIGDNALNDIPSSQTQMSLWAIWSAPLYMSNDLRNITSWAKAILQNTEVIAINQDPLVQLGYRVMRSVGEAWCKNLANGDVAIALRNPDTANAHTIAIDLSLCGITTATAAVRDVWAHANLPNANYTISANVLPRGTALFRVTPLH